MNDFERVKELYDLLDFSRGLTMMRRSGKSFKGLCPIHGENTPSYEVNPEMQLLHQLLIILMSVLAVETDKMVRILLFHQINRNFH